MNFHIYNLSLQVKRLGVYIIMFYNCLECLGARTSLTTCQKTQKAILLIERLVGNDISSDAYIIVQFKKNILVISFITCSEILQYNRIQYNYDFSRSTEKKKLTTCHVKNNFGVSFFAQIVLFGLIKFRKNQN